MGFNMMKGTLVREGWKYLFGAAALVASVGFTLKTIQPAYAVNGPSVNLGSNPTFNYYDSGWAYFHNGQRSLSFNIPSGQVLTITKFYTNDTSECVLDIDGVGIRPDSISQLKIDSTMTLALESKDPGNSGVKCGSYYPYENRIYVEGYYSKE